MNTPPFVSVIVPVYNGAEYLSEAVESAVGNGYADLEVIIVDDGSTDGSAAVAQGLAGRYPDQVRLLFHPDRRNHGVSAARNRGLEAARGKYVAFLDADDRMLPGHLAASVADLEANGDVALVYGRMRHFRGPGVSGPDAPVEWGNGPGRGRVPSAFARLLGGNFIPITAAVCRMASVRAAGGFDLGLSFAYEDYLLWTKLAYREPVFYTDRCTAEYRVHPASYTSNYARERWASVEELEYLRRLWQWLPPVDTNGRRQLLEAEVEIGSRILYRLCQSARRGDGRQAVREAGSLLRLPHRSQLLQVPGRWCRNRKASRGATASVGVGAGT